MSNSLGIFISSNNHFDKVIKICRAAKNKGIDVTLFFSHMGVLLTQDPRFADLECQNISVCKVGFEGHGLKTPVPGLDDKNYTTQAMHAELIDDCDRYLVF